MVGRAWSQPFTAEPHYWVSGFWDGYIRHDSFHLRYIIREGYRRETEGTWKGMSTNAAFFPLYPYTVKALTTIPGYGKLFKTVFPPGLILSNVSLLLAMAYLLRIARMSLDEDGARRSLVYLLAYPTSFYFSCFYTEGLFLLTVTASCYHFLNGRHFRCGAWGLLAAMTRSPGIMLLPAFLLGHLWERGQAEPLRFLPALAQPDPLRPGGGDGYLVPEAGRPVRVQQGAFGLEPELHAAVPDALERRQVDRSVESRR